MSALDHPQVDDAILEEFLERQRSRLKALIAHYHVPTEDIEDILQQALLALVYRWDTVRDPEAWLVGTIRNRCLLYWRDRRRKLYEAVDATMLEWMADPLKPEQEGADLARDLAAVLARLPHRCRSLLEMRYFMGYDPPELAARLGYSPTSISKITQRCLAAMLRQLTAAGLHEERDERAS
jgi:RNA polymerase sigma factor (sigma-70 family)